MGHFIDGEWHTGNFRPASGAFQRAPTRFHDHLGDERPAQSGRYHLYVSYACPWAHRTLIARHLKGLQDHIGVSVVSPLMGDDGWDFEPWDDEVGDTLDQRKRLREVYLEADPHYTGRVTVPVLWDNTAKNIVNNESAKLLRVLDREFGELADSSIRLCPPELEAEIDAMNERVYESVNNGVYKCGFAGSQEAYDEAVDELFDTLDWLEEHLSTHRYLVGDRLTEADIRLYTTLVRFDPVYAFHFRCNKRLLCSYENLSAYLRELYSIPAFRETTKMDHIRHHYYGSHPSIHPSRILPAGPIIDLDVPHDRAKLGGLDPMDSLRS